MPRAWSEVPESGEEVFRGVDPGELSSETLRAPQARVMGGFDCRTRVAVRSLPD